MAKNLLPVSLILVLVFFAGQGLLHPGLPPTHDGEYHIIRFYEFNKVLKEGVWYPRWAPDLNKGYGVPLFNYVYPLSNYVAALLHFFGASFIDAFKLNMFIAMIVGAVFMYLWVKQFWGEWGGFVASIVYTYSPYHFLDIYIRGSVGEVWALGFFPAFLWAVTRFIKDRNLIFMPITAVIFSLVIFSHNILALMSLPFAFTYIFFLCLQGKDRKYMMLNTLPIILLGLGLSAIFWLPAVLERGYVRGLEVFDYRRHFVEIYQLIFPSWGSGFSADPTTQGLSFQIGVANLLVLVASIFLLAVFRKKSKVRQLSIFMVFWVILAIFLMLKISQSLWELIPLMPYFQFPWRFLSLVILLTSFLAGSLVYYWPRKILVFCLVGLSIFLSIDYAKPAYYHLRDDNYYITKSNFIEGTNSPGNVFNTIWFNENLLKPSQRIEILPEKERQVVRVNTAYFPGWQAYADGIKVKTEVDENGLIRFFIPLRSQKIEIKFLDGPIRSLAKIISFLSFLILSLLFLRSFHARIKK